jgi:predicted Zn-dependent protease
LADNLAGFIPPEGERALGEATFGQIREALDETGLNPLAVCEAPEGVAAIDALVTRLSGERDYQKDVTVSVLDHDMVNAFALPGGFVVLFRGLIEAADGPDEVAAVLAHEIGHVVSSDPTRHALRSAGSIGVLGLLFGDFAGGAAVLFLAERLISAQYSQGAEIGADAFAHDVLAHAGISPGALGEMFENMRAKHGDAEGVAAHFLSHPALGDRIEAAKAVVEDDVTYTPSMTDAEWAALQGICAEHAS